MIHACNPSIWEVKDLKFKVSPSYMEDSASKKKSVKIDGGIN
jgi:hypothetical protein